MKLLRYLSVGLFALTNMPFATASVAKKTVVLQRALVPATDRELGLGIADFPPNSAKPVQSATGPEVVYVLSGELTVHTRGQLDKTYHSGESWSMPAGVIHQAVAGPAGAKVVAAWVLERGKTFNIPATK